MGYVIAFTGHRNIYGYNYNTEEYQKLMNLLTMILENEIHNGVDKFISGGAIGFDTIAFSCVNFLKQRYPFIKNTIAIPFKNQYIKWSNEQKRVYFNMLNLSDLNICVDKQPDYRLSNTTREDIYHPAKMQKRNEFMVDKCDFLIACWNYEKKGGTYNCISYAITQGKPILIINPTNLEYKLYNTGGM